MKSGPAQRGTTAARWAAVALLSVCAGRGGAADQPPERISLAEAIKQNVLGLSGEPPADRQHALKDARDFQQYRRSPEHGFGARFKSDCEADPDFNRFCFLLKPSPSKPRSRLEPSANRAARERFAGAVRDVSAAAQRPPRVRAQVCQRATPALLAIVQDGEPRGLQAPSLYWLWTCAHVLGQEDQAKRLSAALWLRHPFSWHSAMAVPEQDPRVVAALAASDVPAWERSEQNDHYNAVLAGIEALYEMKDFASAMHAGERLQERLEEGGEFASVEPEARAYFASLMARIGRETPSVLAAGPVVSALARAKPEWLSRSLLGILFPIDFAVRTGSHAASTTLVWDLMRSSALPQEDPFLWMALAHQESAFNPRAASDRDAFGIMQMKLVRALESYGQLPASERRQPLTEERLIDDPALSVRLAAMAVRDSAAAFHRAFPRLPPGGAWALALAGYHAGHRGVLDWATAQGPRLSSLDLRALVDLVMVDGAIERSTSAYVASILAKREWYVRLYGQSALPRP